jgi:electron transfer flavoprotein alpha subunit
MCVTMVLEGEGRSAARRARALGGFLRDGLRLPADSCVTTATHVFFSSDDPQEALASAPTRDVRLTRTPAHHPDLIAAALCASHASGGSDLYVFPAGPLGTELAARLAARTGGSVITGVREATADHDMLRCRRTVYASHLAADVDLDARPWCVTLDSAWADAPFEPPAEHVVAAEAAVPPHGDAAPGPLREVEPLEPPPTGDLENARLLVVAGRGAGSRDGVARIAAAAAHMGAAFGVTRPVAMSGWAPPDRQVGVSGTRTAPAVCIVAGASGAPAFLWGVERAGFIAAVDIDSQAPIAGEADVVVLDDAVAVVEALADLVAGQRRALRP